MDQHPYLDEENLQKYQDLVERRRIPVQLDAEALTDIAEEETFYDEESEEDTGIPFCRHILQDGRRCKCAAKRGSRFCRFHLEFRLRVAMRPEASYAQSHLPPLECRAGIQHALNELIVRYSRGLMNDRHFRNMLDAINLAMKNIAKADFAGRKNEEYIDSVPLEEEEDAEDEDSSLDSADQDEAEDDEDNDN